MACGVARLSQDPFRINLAFCCACGSTDLEVCQTSKALGPPAPSPRLSVERGRKPRRDRR